MNYDCDDYRQNFTNHKRSKRFPDILKSQQKLIKPKLHLTQIRRDK